MIVVLLGYMGCGKSTVGQILAKNLKTNFLDLDDYIELHNAGLQSAIGILGL